MTLDQRIEAILFASAKPFTVKRLAEVTKAAPDDVQAALVALEERLSGSGSAVMLQRSGHAVELVTRPEAADDVSLVVSEEAAGELTRPSLEALSILSYCGPMTRAELEQIRGVHSALILRNLMLRGLVEEREEGKLGQPLYAVTFDFLNHLGLQSVEALPDYEALRGHSTISDVLHDLEKQPPSASTEIPV